MGCSPRSRWGSAHFFETHELLAEDAPLRGERKFFMITKSLARIALLLWASCGKDQNILVTTISGDAATNGSRDEGASAVDETIISGIPINTLDRQKVEIVWTKG